jgi:uncharacterized protein (UPF0276 family)
VGLAKPIPRFGIALKPRDYRPFPFLENEPLWPEWVEVGVDALLGVKGGLLLHVLDRLRETLPLSLHSTTLSLGSVDPLDLAHVRRLKAVVDRIDPVWLSDHLAWCSYGGRPLELLPLPYTEEALAHMIDRVRQVQDVLGRPILLENPSTYLTFAESEMAEWEFLGRLAEAADCGILLDVNNAYVSGHNNGFDPLEYVRGLPIDRVGEVHMAGHRAIDAELLLDTHEGPVPECVWAVYHEATRRFGPVSTILEWGRTATPLEEMIADCRRWATRAREVVQ